MVAKTVIAGVGARYSEAFRLDPTTGLPINASFNSGTLIGGTLIDGIKTFTYSNPAEQKIDHYGDDRAFAQDALPPTTVGSFTITTAKTNLDLDAFTENTNVVTLDTVIKARLGNTNQRGSEPQNFVSTYRQALDTQRGSATFGKLREWHCAMIPSTRIINNLQAFDQAASVKTYEGIPTPVTYTPWNTVFDQATWGATQGEYIELVFDYKPICAIGQGNGSLTTFALPKAPVDTAHTHVWVAGTLATVSSVNTSTTSPTVTLSVAPASNAFIFAIVEHNQPN